MLLLYPIHKWTADGLRVPHKVEDEGLDKHEHNIVVLRVVGEDMDSAEYVHCRLRDEAGTAPSHLSLLLRLPVAQAARCAV